MFSGEYCKNFKNTNFEENLGTAAFNFPSIFYLDLDIHGTPEMVKKVKIALDSTNIPSPNRVPVVVLKKYDPGLTYVLADIFKMGLKESFFPDCQKTPFVISVFINIGSGLWLKNYSHVSFILSLVKSLKNLQIRGLLVTSRNVLFFLISSMVSGTHVLLQILWHLHLTELLWVRTDWDYFSWSTWNPRLLTGFENVFFFTNWNIMELKVRCLVLFLHFAAGSFVQFGMTSFRSKVLIILVFFKVPF